MREKDEQINKLQNEYHELEAKSVMLERSMETDECDFIEKTLDVFISYRRSNGSQLASLLKVFLELRNFSVFLDIDR